jgi:hypothetical protein
MEGSARVDAVMRNAFGFGDDTHISRVFLRSRRQIHSYAPLLLKDSPCKP